jgi:plastocyanin
VKRYWPFIVVIVVIVAVAAIAIGNKNSKNATTPPPAPTPTSSNAATNNTNPTTASPSGSSSSTSENNKVTIANMSYSPADITVKKGTSVTWTNNDSIAHTVTADSNNAFDSGNLGPGKTFSFTFNNVGTFAYHCTYHSDMHGKVTVTE